MCLVCLWLRARHFINNKIWWEKQLGTGFAAFILHTLSTAQHTRTKLLYKYNTITNISVQNVAVQWLVRCEWMNWKYGSVEMEFHCRKGKERQRQRRWTKMKWLFIERIVQFYFGTEFQWMGIGNSGMWGFCGPLTNNGKDFCDEPCECMWITKLELNNYLSYLTGWATWLFGSQIGSIMATFVVRLSFGLISWLNAIQSSVDWRLRTERVASMKLLAKLMASLDLISREIFFQYF